MLLTYEADRKLNLCFMFSVCVCVSVCESERLPEEKLRVHAEY